MSDASADVVKRLRLDVDYAQHIARRGRCGMHTAGGNFTCSRERSHEGPHVSFTDYGMERCRWVCGCANYVDSVWLQEVREGRYTMHAVRDAGVGLYRLGLDLVQPKAKAGCKPVISISLDFGTLGNPLGVDSATMAGLEDV